MWRWRGRAAWMRRLHNGPDTLEGLLERHVAGRHGPRTPGVTSTRREALSLYRDIWRASRLFIWTNQQGVPWKELLRESARREFEQARYETDPEIITRLLVVGKDAVETALDKVVSKREELLTKGPDSHIRKGM